MKRLILLFLPFVSVFINAEELKFVTVLSSPVGTFNKLEAVNPAVPAKSPTINFCTSIGNGGTVTLQAKDASKHPTMSTVNMSSNTELGGNGANYVLSRITMNKGGVLQGSRLLANTLQVNQPSAGKSENLYINNLTVAGAKTGKLHVNGTESYIETSHADPEMVWSNQYQNDKACGSTTECSKQYLLKEKREIIANTCPTTPGDPRTWWDASAQKCGCPKANERYHNGACCSEDTPKSDTRCWKASSESGGLVWANILAPEHTDTQNIANQGTTSLTCSTSGIIGWAGGTKTNRKCPHYSCSGSCELNCNSIDGEFGMSQTIVPNPKPSMNDLGPCSTEGEICIASVQISTNKAGCKANDGYDNLWCFIDYAYSTCVKSKNSTTSYIKLWRSADTRYGCGH